MNKPIIILKSLTAFLFAACSDTPTSVTKQAPESSITQSEQSISTGKLAGLYRDAGTDSPVVLIVPGSGPTDLNGNSPLGINSNTYKQLSEALGERGISTVRVDKRGMFSSKPAGDANKVTVDIYAQDYKNWSNVILEKTGQSCVFMLGHSEGGIMVSAASIENANVCGLILIASPGKPFGDILREQLNSNPANTPILEDALSAIDRLEDGQKVDVTKFHPALQNLFAPAVQDYLISVMGVDPANLAKLAQQKTLIIQGANDLQVSETDAERLAEATGGKLVVIDGVNHVLKDAPIDRMGNMLTYQNPDLPLASEVVDAISGFVLE